MNTTKYVKTTRYGKSEVASRLKIARIRAGFPSAKAAAVSFGWGVARYRAHESGTRRVMDADITNYSGSFKITKDWLRGKDDLDSLPNGPPIAGSEHFQTANRLVLARYIAGFPSGRAAAKYFGWRPSTYSAHENGQNAVSEAMAQIYALSFGTSADWLLGGTGKSRLPKIPHKLLSAAIRSDSAPFHNDPALMNRFNAYIDGRRKGNPGAIRRLSSRLRVSSPHLQSRKSIPVAEVSWSRARQLVRGTVDKAPAATSATVWSFPEALLPPQAAHVPISLVVLSTGPDEDKSSQRALIDLTDTQPRAGHVYAVLTDDALTFRRFKVRAKAPSKQGAIIGRIVAFIEFLNHSKAK